MTDESLDTDVAFVVETAHEGLYVARSGDHVDNPLLAHIVESMEDALQMIAMYTAEGYDTGLWGIREIVGVVLPIQTLPHED